MFAQNKHTMEFNYEKIAQAAVTGVIACHLLAIILKGQKIPQRKMIMPVLSSMATSYIMGNKSLSLKGDDNLQIYVASALAAYMYQM